MKKLFENDDNKVKKKPENKKTALKKAGKIVEKSNGINTVNGIDGLKKNINKISQLLKNIENMSKEYETSETDEETETSVVYIRHYCRLA
jgi:hypothetical protein